VVEPELKEPGANPLPVIFTVTLVVPSVTVAAALWLPCVVGAKLTVNVQVAAGAKAASHVPADIGKAAAKSPVCRMKSAPVEIPPPLVMVTVVAVPVLLTAILPKSNETGSAASDAGAIAVPVIVVAVAGACVP
jgi:hypothetical protein